MSDITKALLQSVARVEMRDASGNLLGAWEWKHAPVESATGDPAPADPVPYEPILIDPILIDPVPVTPLPADPVLVEPAPADPDPVDPPPVDPLEPDPILIEPDPVAPADPSAPGAPALTGAAGMSAHTATIGGYGNSLKGPLFHEMARTTYRRSLAVDRIEGGRVYTDNLSFFETLADGAYDHGRLVVFRPTADGDGFTEAQTRIIRTVLRGIFPLHGAREVAAGESGFAWAPAGWTKAGATMYVALASVRDGKRSEWSAPIPYVYPDAPSGQGAAANTVPGKDPRQMLVDPSLEPPAASIGTDPVTGAMVVSYPAGDAVVAAYSWHPEFSGDEYLEVEDASILTPDCLVWVDASYGDIPKAKVVSPRVWRDNGTLSRFGQGALGRFPEDRPAGVTLDFDHGHGDTGVVITVPDGAEYKLASYTHAGAHQTFYDVLVPGNDYRIAIKAKPLSPECQVRIGMDRVGTQTLTLQDGTTEAVFTPESLDAKGSATETFVTIVGPAKLYLEGVFGHNKTEGEPWAPTQAEIESFLFSAPSYVRLHSTCKTNPDSYTGASMLRDVGPVGTGGTSLVGFMKWLEALRGHLHAKIDGMAHVLTPAAAQDLRQRLRPWVQIEPHLGQDELKTLFAGLMPYVKNMGGVIPERGNENWNGIPAFYTLRATGNRSGGWWNGKLLDHMAEAAMSVPGYDPSQWAYYLGGWVNGPGWNKDSIAASKHADFFGFAAYNGGWDSGLTQALQASDPAAMFKMLAQSYIPNSKSGKTRTSVADDLIAMLAEASLGRAKPIWAKHYEAGPGYVMNGLNGAKVTPEQAASQELLMKSVAGGTATLDAFLLTKARGMVSTNFFTIGAGTHWRSQTHWHNGGAYNPPYQWFAFANWHLNGDIRDITPPDAPDLLHPETGALLCKQVRAYEATRPDGSKAQAFANLSPTDPVTIHVPEGVVTAVTMTGKLDATNLTPETAGLATLQEAPVMPGEPMFLEAGQAMAFLPA